MPHALCSDMYGIAGQATFTRPCWALAPQQRVYVAEGQPQLEGLCPGAPWRLSTSPAQAC